VTLQGGTNANWEANRDKLGMIDYGMSSAANMPGNSFVLLLLTRLSGYDWRPYWVRRNLPSGCCAYISFGLFFLVFILFTQTTLSARDLFDTNMTYLFMLSSAVRSPQDVRGIPLHSETFTLMDRLVARLKSEYRFKGNISTDFANVGYNIPERNMSQGFQW
jgi:hypothetical protein